MAIFRYFQHGGRPPSWICDACVGTTREGHMVVFITVQNLIGIHAVVLIICTFFDFASLLENAYSQHEKGFLGGFGPLNYEPYEKKTKKIHPCASLRRLSYHA